MKELNYEGLLSEDTKNMGSVFTNDLLKDVVRDTLILAEMLAGTGIASVLASIPVLAISCGIGTALSLVISGSLRKQMKKNEVTMEKLEGLKSELKLENIDVDESDILKSYEESTDLLRRKEHCKEVKDANVRYFCMLSNEQKLVVLKEIKNYLDDTNKLYLLNDEETKNCEASKGLRLTK